MSNLLEGVPFNLTLLILAPKDTANLRPIKVLDIFEGGTKNFHPDGLFSIETFGRVGDEKRNRLYAYIELNLPVFHPTLFKTLIGLKELYNGILSGRTYALFDKELKDFVPSNPIDGKTGFSFFMKHFNELQFEDRTSTSREFSIKLLNKYRSSALIEKLIVLPAGLRDYTIDRSGKPEEDEVNSLYRKILSIANVAGIQNKNDISHMDQIRYNLQLAIQELYAYLINILEGKGKLIQGSWTNRTIFQSTRNVITGAVSGSKVLGDELTLTPNHTVVGIYQFLCATLPLTINLVREHMQEVFTGPNSPAKLIDAKTLQPELCSVDAATHDRWMTQEGLESVLARFEIERLRHDPIMVEGKYVFLTYNDGKCVKLFQDIRSLPEGFDQKYVKPTTYAEFFYMAVFERAKRIPAYMTRYPVISYGGIYPTLTYLKTTTKSNSLCVLGENWEKTDKVANEFPIQGVSFMNSLSPSLAHISPAGADKKW